LGCKIQQDVIPLQHCPGQAHEIVAMLKAGSVSPLQLIDVVEQRISATEALVHASPITCFDRAREKAWEIMRNCGEKSRGFLHGLPILIKDKTIGIQHGEIPEVNAKYGICNGEKTT